jgi:hypothetical protein
MAKPHIYFKRGYWRVSKKTTPYHKSDKAWSLAYNRIHYLNAQLREVTNG